MLVIARMRRCDVFVCMSGIYVQAPRFAKWRYDAKVIIHRASVHIQAQHKILSDLTAALQVSLFIITREIRSYDIADLIAVPSRFVAQSFGASPAHARKIIACYYGVDLEAFPFHGGMQMQNQTVLYVGNWSYQKGVDILAEAILMMANVRFIHVGAIIDIPFPDHPQFVHHEPVNQGRLQDFYALASVFVLPSRQDGFGVVLCQALASGLRVVCTQSTGGSDLAQDVGLARLITVVPSGNVAALCNGLSESLLRVSCRNRVAPISEAERNLLSWKTYATKQLEIFNNLCDRRVDGVPPKVSDPGDA